MFRGGLDQCDDLDDNSDEAFLSVKRGLTEYQWHVSVVEEESQGAEDGSQTVTGGSLSQLGQTETLWRDKKKTVGLFVHRRTYLMSFAGGLRMMSRQKTVALTLFPENPMNSSNLKILWGRRDNIWKK